jgi:hypothetical protein
MLKQRKRDDGEADFADAFDENGKLRDGVTRIRIKLMDAASVPTKVVAEPGWVTTKDSTKRDFRHYDSYDAELSQSFRASDAKACAKCDETNANDAAFCDQCGEAFPDNGNDAADPAISKPPTGVTSKVSAVDHATRMEALYQARDTELANAWRTR